MPAGRRLAEAAESFIGTRYRLHGRDPVTGVDCIGLLAAALAAIGRPAPLPTGYALRMLDAPGLAEAVRVLGFVPAPDPFEPGDVAFVRVSSCQFHLAIAGLRHAFVHAHAGLRRVVIAPGLGDWRLVGSWRLPSN